MAWDGRIPYMDGRPMVYVDSWSESKPEFEWRNNDEFDDTLSFVRFTRGRSAARVDPRGEVEGGDLLAPEPETGILNRLSRDLDVTSSVPGVSYWREALE